MSFNGEIINQLVDIYLDEEDWHTTKLPREEAIKYFEKLIQKGCITYYKDGNDKVIGYMETWMINANQLNRIKHHEHFSAMKENVQNGSIGFLASVWIKNDFRNNEVAKIFKKRFDEKTKHCNLIAGMKRNKELRIHRNTGV